MNHHWVANRDLTVKDGVKRAEGEYVPEAFEWRDPELWERAGHVRKVQGPPPAPFVASVPGPERITDKPEALRTRPVSPKPDVPPVRAPGPGDPSPKVDKLARINQEIAAAKAVPSRPSLEIFGPNIDKATERIEKLEREKAEIEADARAQERVATEPEPAEPEPASTPSRSKLAKMKAADVRQVAKEHGIKARFMTKAQAIDAILER